MKGYLRNFLSAVLMVVGIMALLCALALPARGQVAVNSFTPAITNNTLIGLTNGTYTFGSGSNAPVDVWQGRELGLFILAGAQYTTNTSNVTVTVEFTPDGTNWLDSPTWTPSFNLLGTTAVRVGTNVPAEVYGRSGRMPVP